MEITIWKFPLNIKDEQILLVPEGAKFFTVIEQASRPAAYAFVNPSIGQYAIKFYIRGTGHPIEDWLLEMASYLGTVKIEAGFINFVWHIFVDKEAYYGDI